MRVIAYDTYAKFAKKYKIPLTGQKSQQKLGKKSGLKSMTILAKQIHAHEKARKVKGGLYS